MWRGTSSERSFRSRTLAGVGRSVWSRRRRTCRTTPPATLTEGQPRVTARCSPDRVPSMFTGSTRWFARTWSRGGGRPCCCAPVNRSQRAWKTRRDPDDSAGRWGSAGPTMGPTCPPIRGFCSNRVGPSPQRSWWGRESESIARPVDAYGSRWRGTSGSPDRGRPRAAELLQLRPLVSAAAGRSAEAARGADVLLAVERVAAAASTDDVDDLATAPRWCSLSHGRAFYGEM